MARDMELVRPPILLRLDMVVVQQDMDMEVLGMEPHQEDTLVLPLLQEEDNGLHLMSLNLQEDNMDLLVDHLLEEEDMETLEELLSLVLMVSIVIHSLT